MRQQIVEEIEQWKAKDIDKDGKMKVKSKDEVKEVLGRSPYLSDALMMRAFFEYKQHGNGVSQNIANSPQFGNRNVARVKGPFEYSNTYGKKEILKK